MLFAVIEAQTVIANDTIMDALKQHLKLHATALQLRAERNEVLASNIANAATPGYKARDFDFAREFASQVDTGRLRVTMDRHLPRNALSAPDRMQYRQPLNPSLDGNTVELSVEQMEFSENTSRYATTLSFLDSRISGLRKAIKGE